MAAPIRLSLSRCFKQIERKGVPPCGCPIHHSHLRWSSGLSFHRSHLKTRSAGQSVNLRLLSGQSPVLHHSHLRWSANQILVLQHGYLRCSTSRLLKWGHLRWSASNLSQLNFQLRHCHKGPTAKQEKKPRSRGVLRYITLLIVIGCGAVLAQIALVTEEEVKKDNPDYLKIDFYRKLPLKVMSRAWGKFNELDLPVILRRPLLGLYVWLFNCNMEEAMDKELRNYRNLGEFFRRILRPDVRKIHDDQVTSPADGRILHFGVVKDGILEQVKGVTYSLKGFLGPPSWQGHIYDIKHLTDSEYFQTLKIKPDHELYHCVIYLAPGDYHRFHSATNWIVQYRRHFPGDLLSVNPSIAKWLKGLFNFNERVVYAGTWEHGFFSYTPVGATNVGSIKVYCDKELQTNTGHKHHTLGTHYDKDLRDSDKNGVDILKGEMFGEFNLGSTVVLVFEAPKNFKFSVENNQKVRMGEPLGTVV